MKPLLLGLALGATMMACNPTQLPDPIDQPVAPDASAEPMPLGQVDAPSDSPHALPFGNPARSQAARQMVTAAGPVAAAADRLLKRNLPLAETDRQMRRLFEAELPRDARWLVHSQYGMRMLRRLLADPTSEPEAIAFYAEPLIHYRNPNADVLLLAIDRIGTEWTPEQRAGARAQVEEGALDWLQRSSCETCQTRASLREVYPAGEGLDARNRKILEALGG
ncbi:MAG: hypothetical protein HKN71_07340 [Gemmatimonadetes bacterium]|nr:hypothetical protein [Gemmatimonadota bacterium]